MSLPFVVTEGPGPIVATAIHAGHDLRPECARAIALDAGSRLREEDPFTDRIATIVPTHLVARRSRFEVDLNRVRECAVYARPDDAWGLEVWREPPSPALIAGSLAVYDAFYTELERLLRAKIAMHGAVVVLDIHSYNHRRGEARTPADPLENPEINVGTKSADRTRWGTLFDRFIHELELAGPFDVRENIKFGGGAMAAWIHATFPRTAVALSLEFKKSFMDEWTGELVTAQLDRLIRGLRITVPGLTEEAMR